MTDQAFKTAGIPGKIAYIEKTVNGETVFVPYVELNTGVTLTAGDIEIGAVELKDAATDSRASIEAANTARTTATKVVAVQHVDATGAVLPASPVLGAGSALVGKVGIDQTTPGTTNKVSIGTDGTVAINTALPAGTNAIGKLAANSGVDIGDVDITSIAAGSNLIGDVGLSGARTTGGTTPYKNLDVDETEDEIKATAGQVYWIHAMNLSAAKLYLKFYNATAATVVVGTTVPTLTFPVPTFATTNGAGFNLAIPNGIAFSTAITVAGTTGFADNDTGAPGANELIINLGYA